MKIILPYKEEQVRGEQAVRLLDGLDLEEHQLIDLILLHWTTYAFGRIEEIYERTVEEISMLVDDRGFDVLRQHTDEIVQLFTHLTQYLRESLGEFPDELGRLHQDDEDGYHFLRVDLIDSIGSRLILTSDAIDT